MVQFSCTMKHFKFTYIFLMIWIHSRIQFHGAPKNSQSSHLIKIVPLLWSTAGGVVKMDNGKLIDGLNAWDIAWKMIHICTEFLISGLLLTLTIGPDELTLAEIMELKFNWKRGINIMDIIMLCQLKVSRHNLTTIWLDVRGAVISICSHKYCHNMDFGLGPLNCCWNINPWVTSYWSEDVIQIDELSSGYRVWYTATDQDADLTPGHCDGHSAGSASQ